MTSPSIGIGDDTQPTTVEEIAAALADLGGEADVAAIKDRVTALRGGKPPQYASAYTYRNTIQKIIEDYCPQSDNFRGTTRFARVSRARYRLVINESSHGPADLLGWWVSQPLERYWLEITDRDDLGVNLKAPQTNEEGEDYWSYSLIRAVRAGDIVFHYHQRDQAIVAVSRAAGAVWDEDIVWAARGAVELPRFDGHVV